MGKVSSFGPAVQLYGESTNQRILHDVRARGELRLRRRGRGNCEVARCLFAFAQ
eukprot:COSAG01_NODE_56316_length_319_cov_0.709091_1_plen_53_part_10